MDSALISFTQGYAHYDKLWRMDYAKQFHQNKKRRKEVELGNRCNADEGDKLPHGNN